MIWASIALLALVASALPSPGWVLLLVAGFACAYRAGERGDHYHRWQLLYEPPGPSTGRYRKGVWCVLCGKEKA